MDELQKAIDHFGTISGLAKALDVAPPTVYEWIKGRRPMALERAIQIEQLTDGKVRADKLVAAKADLIGYLRSTKEAA